MNPDELDNVTMQETVTEQPSEQPATEGNSIEEVDSGINLSISTDAESIPEGDEGDTTLIGFDINLSQPLEQDLTLNLTSSRTGNNAATSDSGQVNIAAGETSVRFDLDSIQGDNIPEENETITASITSASERVNFNRDPVTITVEDDDSSEATDSGGETPSGEEEATDSDSETADGEGNTVYRFFNPATGGHFYTADENERATLEEELDNAYDFEGASYHTLDPLTGTEVYRFFNSQTGVHLYTTDENERDFIQNNLDVFSFEGTAFNAYETQTDGSIPVYRFFEPNIGVHFYTTNENERDFVDNELANYQSEGIAYYALPLEDGFI